VLSSDTNRTPTNIIPEPSIFASIALDSLEQTSDSGLILTLEQTPDEVMELAHRELRQNLAQELLELIKTASPAFFEQLVIELLLKMGYGDSLVDAGMAIGKSGDEGIDGIIKEDRLGLDAIYVQLANYAIEVNLGVSVVSKYQIKRLDLDYFDGE
jgi:restriction system protein